ncbi:MAG TPA: hypothetical protein VE046_10845 [Steroidobacteraceae bacterium]|nr:hypothetical protein [Steroidobacteraceae bacterium]
MSAITLLGPQFREPNLGPVLKELALTGPLVAVTAGWQEREGEIDELAEHIGREVTDLGLYARTDDLFAHDRVLFAEYRARQDRLRALQDLYRIQLEHALGAVLDIWHRGREGWIARAARRSALGTMRRLDREHMLAIERIHQEFARRVALADRPSIERHRKDLAAGIEGAAAVLIAGGHVAVLVNRLRIFGLTGLLKQKTVLAWSAGAMAIAERIVLFHDHPPQGAGVAELFDLGLGLVPGVLPLPHAQDRLRLHDGAHVSILTRRFAPAHCVTLDHGSVLSYADGRLSGYANSWRLTRDGTLAEADAP